MFPMPDRPRLFTVAVILFVLAALLVLAGCATSMGTDDALSGSVSGDPAQEGSTTVAQAPPGIGGTGEPGTKSPGIGGTGDVSAGVPGIGGTGIVGTITGFGSIFVNGYEVDYAPDLPVRFKDATIRSDQLRIGHVVEAEAVSDGKRLRARRLSVRHEVAGPIEHIDRARRIAVVFGQRVEVPRGGVYTSGGLRRLSFDQLSVGDHIDVSGLRRANGVVAASHVDRTGPGAAAVLRGRVMASDPSGITVNGMRVEAPRQNIGRALVSGQNVVIVGTTVGGKLRARRVNPLPARPFEGRVKNLSIEGFVTRAISGGVAIGETPVTRLPARARLRAGDRVILEGPLDRRGSFAPTRLRQPKAQLEYPGAPRRTQVPVSPAPRQQVLPPERTAPLPPPVIRGPAPRSRIYRSPSGGGRR